MVQKNSLRKIIIICGATASSKTALAVDLAKKIDGEVVSADSLYVYKGLDIGTAKPTKEEMQGIPHYLIDVVEPTQTFSVGDYKELAIPIIEDILSRSKVPIICGGTGFYINSILYDMSYGKAPANLEVREKFFQIYHRDGAEAVHNYLKEIDPASAEKIHFNDVKRVIRAIEIYESGCKKSSIQDDLTPNYQYLAYSIKFPRETLYERIEKRVDIMFDGGLLNEVENLLQNGVKRDDQCMQGIGYKEIFEYLDGETSLREVKDKIKLNTRHYAKRQITFFKKLNGLKFLEPNTLDDMTSEIIKDYKYD